MKKRFLVAVLLMAGLLACVGCTKGSVKDVPAASEITKEPAESGNSADAAANKQDKSDVADSARDTDKEAESQSADNGERQTSSQSETCKQHKDADDNGLCDVCGKDVLTSIDFYAINDLHGKFEDEAGQPGVDELTSYFKERFLTDDNPILLSSGDMWQGSAESNMTRGSVVIDWMNELGFASMTLGNHEFDWGEEQIEENSKKADFPFLAINVMDVETGERVDYCESSVLLDLGDIQVGIIGAVGDCYSSIAADWSGGFYILTGDDLTELVKDESLKLRGEGADFIVYSLHDGYSDSFYSTKVMPDSRLSSYYDTALSKEYVDLVFEGHTHQQYVIMDSKGVYHLQDGGENDAITHVSVTVNEANYKKTILTTEVVSSSEYAKKSSDPLRDDILGKYAEELAGINEVVGHVDTYMGRDELRQQVAELYYKRGKKIWGDDYDIVLGGGFLSAREPGHLEAGDVTYGMLYAIFPFDNYLVLCSCSGYDLKRVFFESTNSNYFIGYGSYGEEVRDSIDLTATYYVVVDTYSSTYEPNHLTEIERYNKEVFARDLYADYLRKKAK